MTPSKTERTLVSNNMTKIDDSDDYRSSSDDDYNMYSPNVTSLEERAKDS